ncbi:type II toxin-antitoxin system CcdA family antitoxin [Enterobacteriaceae bacterium BIT-l23]|uniref:Acetoacetyl-CoA synthase n=1 Tax=Jejubacter calystegiae TaxID=2579935 RepID=A0A4V1G808_9ENTR|nr:type II toxin-antitoxin system CcdA family antitoxin [Jejubacter calystegiae]NUU66481.1 type II toxin-antitoxin system CcdA family antitoxin [Enterobacteriaceae bacterium BIT-l23]QCT21497.1 acetoacetyl-CoA synthase [Jejubacter calystegiae]
MAYRVTDKKRTNVTIRADLLQEARACGINLSALLEHSLQEKLKEARRVRYLEENQAAFESHNRFIQKAGLFSDDEGIL